MAAFLTIGITYGTKGAYGIIQLSMLQDLGWTRAQVAGAFSLNYMVYAMTVLFIGKAMDKIGAKMVMIIGAVLTGLAYFLMQWSTTPFQFYLLYGLLLGVGGGCMGMVPGPTTVSRWFVKKRGRALALTVVANPLGCAIFIFLAKGWLVTIGWKDTFTIMAFAAWALVIIPVALMMKNWPEDIGLQPDGSDAPPTADSTSKNQLASDDEVWTYKRIFTSPKAWMLIMTYFFFAANGMAQQVHQVPHLISNGLTRGQAIDALGIGMLLSIISMLMWPAISDFIDRKVCMVVSLIFQIFATIILLNAHTMEMTYVFVFVMGLAYMGGYGLFSALGADLFGRKSLGTINGVMATIAAIGASLATYAGGYIYDITKSYTILWVGCIAGLIIAMFLMLYLIKDAKKKKDIPVVDRPADISAAAN